MRFLICFLEGMVTFLSPCILPMLPVYLSWFGGGDASRNLVRTLSGALGFTAGFTTVFVLMGAMAGSLGSLLLGHRTAVNIISGGILVLFGLNYLGIFQTPLFRGGVSAPGQRKAGTFAGFLSAVLFGVAFSLGFTPCVGTFLGSALILASRQGSARTGVLMLLCYSAGLGIPFLLCALLMKELKNALSAVRRHYALLNRICGILLILFGLLMATGIFGTYLEVFS